ncbi:MAG TPA: ABC transporter ATP-binding protein [Thermomicrobiales bacterium]
MWVADLVAAYATASGRDIRAVDGVTFDVQEGEVLGIVGESGCGKSTLASLLALVPPRSLQMLGGRFGIDDHVISPETSDRIPREWRGKLVALLPQRAMNSLNPTARIGDFAFDVLRAHESRVTRRQAIERARQRLEQLALPPRVLESYPHQLSGGMRQRVVTVISTLLNPKVLIADEPTSALDVSSQKALVLLLQRLLDEGYISRIIFITHDLPLLSNIADRIAVFYAGKIVEIGPTKQIVDEPQHPYTRALISSTLVPEPRVRCQRLEGLPGAPPDLRMPPPGCRFHPRCRYATDICAREEPPLTADGDDRLVACWWANAQRQNVEGGTHESRAAVGLA